LIGDSRLGAPLSHALQSLETSALHFVPALIATGSPDS
jgi:hypothetical protein